MVKHLIELDNNAIAQNVSGINNRNIAILRNSFSVKINMRGNKITLHGEAEEIEHIIEIIDDIIALGKNRIQITEDELLYKIDNIKLGRKTSLSSIKENYILLTNTRKQIKPKTENQAEYVKAIESNDMVFSIGPAGTGKTYLAVAMALKALRSRTVRRIVLTRPAVEAGEKIGYLPGSLEEKINPYLRPLYDALFDMESIANINNMLTQNVLEIAPMAFMRGRTLNDAFVILDEAQNTTPEQMKMFLTRLGFGSKTVITGDVTQIDLPQNVPCGLIRSTQILKDISGIKIIYLDKTDVVRHKLVQKIIEAYEKYDKNSDT